MGRLSPKEPLLPSSWLLGPNVQRVEGHLVPLYTAASSQFLEGEGEGKGKGKEKGKREREKNREKSIATLESLG